MTAWRRVAMTMSGVLVASSVSSFASADPASAKRAEKLFKEASDALAQKKYDEACPKLEESDRLERAVGTEYNLAVCYELSQKLASARRTYAKAAAFARETGKETTAREANEREKKLDAAVPRLVLRAPGPPLANALTVRCDDQTIDTETWQKPIELDAGSHRVVASAQGFTTFDKSFTLTEGDRREVVIQVDAIRAAAVAPPPPAPSNDHVADPSTAPPLPWRWVGLGVAAVGAVGMGVGGYFAIHASGQKSDSGCVDGRSCPDDTSADKLRSAKSSADLSTVFVIAGGALVATGVVIFLVSPSSPAPGAGATGRGLEVKLTGAASRELTGPVLSGRF